MLDPYDTPGLYEFAEPDGMPALEPVPGSSGAAPHAAAPGGPQHAAELLQQVLRLTHLIRSGTSGPISYFSRSLSECTGPPHPLLTSCLSSCSTSSTSRPAGHPRPPPGTGTARRHPPRARSTARRHPPQARILARPSSSQTSSGRARSGPRQPIRRSARPRPPSKR